MAEESRREKVKLSGDSQVPTYCPTFLGCSGDRGTRLVGISVPVAPDVTFYTAESPQARITLQLVHQGVRLVTQTSFVTQCLGWLLGTATRRAEDEINGGKR